MAAQGCQELLLILQAAKTAEWDEKMKLGNQWRGLGPEELKFLADKANEKRAAEKIVEDQEKRDLAEYRECVPTFSPFRCDEEWKLTM